MRKQVIMLTNKMQALMCSHMFTNNPNAIKHASDLVASGEIIAVPTDTVYGLCCNANNTEAVQKLFDIKGRTVNKPISLCVSSVKEIEKWTDISYIPNELINKLLPGPVTLVLRTRTNLHTLISTISPVSNQHVCGFRIPESMFMQFLCAELDHPIALTSANVSGKSDSIKVEEFKDLWPYIACVFDHGCLDKRAPSTVVDLSEECKYKIVREGAGLERVKRVLKEFNFEAVV